MPAESERPGGREVGRSQREHEKYSAEDCPQTQLTPIYQTPVSTRLPATKCLKSRTDPRV